MKPIGAAERHRILAVTDEFGVNRAGVYVARLPDGGGSVRRLPGGSIEIVVPEDRPLEVWLPRLRDELIRLQR